MLVPVDSAIALKVDDPTPDEDDNPAAFAVLDAIDAPMIVSVAVPELFACVFAILEPIPNALDVPVQAPITDEI